MKDTRSTLPLAASYARKSTQDDLGIQNQHEINARKALSEGFYIPDHPDFRFSDDSTSGVTVRRRDFDRLRAVLRAGARFVRVYIRDKTRLGRWTNPKRHAQVEMDFADAGAPILYSVLDRQPLDTDPDPSSDDLAHHLMDFVQNLIASHERATLLQRSRDGVHGRLRLGYYPGPRAPYGYARWLFHARTQEYVQEILPGIPVHRAGYFIRLRPATDGSFERVRQIFTMYDGGFSKRGIARWLTDQHVPSSGGATPWSPLLIDRILQNALYIGELVWGKSPRRIARNGSGAGATQQRQPIVFHGFVEETPIPADLFARVRARLDQTRSEQVGKRQATSPLLLTGLVSCARCGAPFRGTHTRGRHQRYAHAWNATVPNPGRAQCPLRHSHLSAARVEAAVLSALDGVLSDPGLASAVGEELAERIRGAERDDSAAEVRGMRRQIARDTRAMHQATDAVSRASNSASALAFRETADRLGAVILEAEARILELDAERRRLLDARDRFLHAVRPSAESVAAAVALGTVAERRVVIRSLVERIRVDTGAQQVQLYVKVA